MASKTLEIKITGDPSGLEAGSAKAIDALKRVDSQAKKAGDSTTKEFEKGRDAAGRFTKGAGEAAESVKKLGDTGSASMAAMGGSIALAQKGMQVLTNLANGVGEAMKKAAEQSRIYAENVTKGRDMQRELAATLGRSPNNAFLAENAKFGTKAGMQQADVVAFRNQLANSGVQFRGNNINANAYETFEEKAAAYSQSKGLNAATGGDFFGGVLGLQDLSKLGDKAWKRALGTGARQLAILGQGRGEQEVLARQMAMVNSSLFSEDKLRGAIQDPDEAATLVSIAAEKSPMSAGEMTRAALRGLSDYSDPTAGPMLKRAGIQPGQSPIEKLRRLAPIIDAEAKSRGMSTTEVLGESFKDHLASEGIGVYLNQGVAKGGFGKRMAMAATLGGDDAADQAITDYQKTETGRAAKANASVFEAQTARGIENSRLDVLRKQALAELIREKEIDTTATNVTDFGRGAVPFGVLGDPTQYRINQRSQKILDQRSAEAGLPGQPNWSIREYATEGAMNAQMDRVQAAGRDPLDMSKVEKLLEEQNALLRQTLTPKTPQPLNAAPGGVGGRP